MKHFGDITKLSGYTLPPVDCITGGSPCQDLSVAGKRAGLGGERSGLFMEQVRIVKEMRERDRRDGRPDHLCRPRYMVWENVPGAFSSNGGRDFQAVLAEVVRIAEPEAPDIPLPEKGKWSKAGCLYDELGGWSIAWRLHDAQFWGVPQRRKRIALVVDFGGLSAPEILFERKGLSRNSDKGGEKRKETARSTGNGSTHAISFQERAGKPGEGKGILIQDEHVGALSTLNNQSVFVPSVGAFNYLMGAKARSIGVQDECSPTLSGDRHDACVYCIEGHVVDRDTAQNGFGIKENIAQTLNATARHAVFYEGYQHQAYREAEKSGPLTAENSNHVRGDTPLVQQPIMVEMTSTKNTIIEDGISTTLTARMGTGGNQSDVGATLRTPCGGDSTKANRVCRQDNVVRRLTPLECERLQGYPDGWTDIGEWTDSKGKKHKDADSPRYKALGNSIAVPFWFWLLRRISAQYERPATLGSLFDGIGGFPYCWERCNGKGTAIWASEIEEFPIAVTKLRFPEEEEP